MQKSFEQTLQGYQVFREKYTKGDKSVMQYLYDYGQKPETMVIACCDSRVDPALILQCDPGDLFVVRNVANIVPPYEKDEAHHGTSAALEFAVCFLQVKHLVILGHSQCGGIEALLNKHTMKQNDFITNWVSLVENNQIINNKSTKHSINSDEYAKIALKQSYRNCITFPWITEKIKEQKIVIHLWFFDIQTGQIFTYNEKEDEYKALSVEKV